MRSLALLPAQKIFAPLRLYRQRYILRLKNTSFGCRQLINKTQLRSAAAPALSSSVAVALCLPLPGAARPLLSAAATVLLSSPPPSLSSCSSPRISCRHPTPSSPDAAVTISPLLPLSFVDCCFKRRTKPLLPTMVPSLSSRLPSLVGCFRCPPPFTLAASHGRRHHQSVTLTAGASTSPSSSPVPPVAVATPPAVEQRAIAVVAAAAAAVGDDTDVRLRVIVVLVVPAIPPPSPQLRASTAPIARRPQIGRWRRDVLLASPRSRDPPRSDPLSNVVAPQAAAAAAAAAIHAANR